METIMEKWSCALQSDPVLQERLELLDEKGFPATRKGDLLCIKVLDKSAMTVRWDGERIHVVKKEAKKPFCSWAMNQEKFKQLFFKDSPPVFTAMNNDQANLKMGVDHHNGALVISFLVILQECMIGGASK